MEKPQYEIPSEYVHDCGYELEVHHVVTEDGYILSMHRVPGKLPNDTNDSNGSNETEDKPAVLLMHGLLGSAADWMVTGNNRSLAFLLVDNGYDVWMGNNRGTTYSKNHTTLPVGSSKFWDFSWHEMGLYDAPAFIDYILNGTDRNELFYIGFSQGTTQFWVLTSLKPEYNKKIKLMSALAPVAYMGHMKGLLKPLSYLATMGQIFYKYTGFFELLSNSFLMRRITWWACQPDTMTQTLCEMISFIIGGYSFGEFDKQNMPRFLEFTPAGCSYKQLVHYAMNAVRPGHFRPYDYGFIRNIRVYGSPIPPEYPIEKITAPIILYNGLNDWLAQMQDVELLYHKLPNVVEKYTITLKGLNHFDFVFGNHVRFFVYNHLIQRMNNYR